MSTEEKRTWLKQWYPWPSWEAKVDRMSDQQVHATYMRMINMKKG